MIEKYEQLRSQVINKDFASPGFGKNIIVTKGLYFWVQNWRSLVASPISHEDRNKEYCDELPSNINSNLISIVSEMVRNIYQPESAFEL